MTARAWAIIAVSKECSERFSLRVLRMRPQRFIYFMRESMAKK